MSKSPKPKQENPQPSAPAERQERGQQSNEPAITDKDLYYILRDVKEGFADLHARLDNIEKSKTEAGELTNEDAPQAPRRYRSTKERAAWESRNSSLLKQTATSVSATMTRADQQAHTIGILAMLQNLGDLANEKFLAFASLIEEKQLLEMLMASRKKPSWVANLERLGKWIVLGVLGFALIEAIFQPQNFALIVGGLRETRNILILVAIVSIFFTIYMILWFRERKKKTPVAPQAS